MQADGSAAQAQLRRVRESREQTFPALLELEDELSNRPPRHRSEAYLAALRAERDKRTAATVHP